MKQRVLSIMIALRGLRRMVCLAALLMIFSGGTYAYTLKVGGVTVTSSNASNVTGDNIEACWSDVNGGKPSVVYNEATKTLTLWNVSIERKGSGNRAILNEDIDGLTVVLKGSNYFSAENSSPLRFNANTTLKCADGNSTIKGKYEGAITVGNSASLIIEDADLDIKTYESSVFEASGEPKLFIKNSTVSATACVGMINPKVGCYAVDGYKELLVDNSYVSLKGELAIHNVITFDWTETMFLKSPLLKKDDKQFVIKIYGSESIVLAPCPEINEKNFPDEGFRKGISDFDENKDGVLDPTIEGVYTNMTIHKACNLKGIEYLPYLEQLRADNIELIRLNLSQNTKLKKLSCRNSRLIALDVSGCTELTYIDCCGNGLYGIEMGKFVNSLPTVKDGELYVYDDALPTNNSMLVANVEKAKKKGWKVLKADGSDFNGLQESGLSLSVEEVTATYGTSFTAPVLSNPNSLEVTYSCYNNVASVASDGKVELLNAGTAKINVNFSGNDRYLPWYESYNLTVKPKTVSSPTITLSQTKYTFDGTAKKPTVTVKDGSKVIPAEEYTVSYSNNTEVGTATVTVTDKAGGNYTVSGSTSFTIAASASTQLVRVGEQALVNGKLYSALEGPCADLPALQEGFISYSSSQNTLTLMGAIINTGDKVGLEIFNSKPGMTIKVSGTCSVTSSKYGLDLTSSVNIEKDGSGSSELQIQSDNSTAIYLEGTHTLTISNINVTAIGKVYGISGSSSYLGQLAMSGKDAEFWVWGDQACIKYMDLSDGPQYHGFYFYQPTGAKYQASTRKVVDADGNEVKNGFVKLYNGIAINEENFPDENFRNWILSQDYGKDGALTVQEIERVNTMDVSDKGIASLKGIEYFTALTELNCSGNLLTELDLSQNTNLTTVDCSGNHISGEKMDEFIASLPAVEGGEIRAYSSDGTEGNAISTAQVEAAKGSGWGVKEYKGDGWVDYAGAIKIDETNFPDEKFRKYVGNAEIDTDQNGYLTENEIAAATAMMDLDQGISSLEGLEFFTELLFLDASNTTLTKLDVSKNTKLRNLMCNGTQLSQIDLSQNKELNYLYLNDNQLTSLNVSKNEKLIYLMCSNNRLTSLDVSKNTSLTSLKCDGNQLTTLNVSNSKGLIFLECAGNAIRGEGMDALVNSLPITSGGLLMVYDNLATDNKITSEQVATAKARGWNVKMSTDLEDYTGILDGDANGDEKVDVADIVAIINHKKGVAVTGFDLSAADVNNDGKADEKDIELIQKIILGE